MIKRTNSNSRWSVCSAVRRIYKLQINQTQDLKKEVFEKVWRTRFPEYIDFKRDFLSMAEQLCDSNRFVKDCNDLNIDPKNVAQHIVLEGVKIFNYVRNNGLKDMNFGSPVQEFNASLVA